MDAHTFDFYKKHPDFSHFRAELCFDGSLDPLLHTDIKKMSVHPPQGFLDRLRQATQSLITESGRQGRARANVARGQVDPFGCGGEHHSARTTYSETKSAC